VAKLTGDDEDRPDPAEPLAPLPSPHDDRDQGLDRDEDRSFAHTIPLMLTLMGLTLLIGVVVILSGLHGALAQDYVPWLAGVPTLTVLAAAVGGLAANAGWQRDRQTNPARPMVYGLVAGITTAFCGFAVLRFLASTNV
jgi:hypothetical protein